MVSGLLDNDCQSIDYTEIYKVDLHVGLIDRLLKAGDINIILKRRVSNRDKNRAAIPGIEQAFDVYTMLQRKVLDDQTGIQNPVKPEHEENGGYNTGENQAPEEINDLIVEGEQIIWRGKPKKNAFILNRALTMFPLALIWLAGDIFLFIAFINDAAARQHWWYAVVFFAVHLFPVWVWMYNVLSAGRMWKNVEYAVTDRRIILRNGLIGYNYQSIYYKSIESVDLNKGFIDRMLKVGDIHISVRGVNYKKVFINTRQLFLILSMQRMFAKF